MLALVLVAPSTMRAQTHVYNLNGTFADQFGGPSLVSLGGSLGATGYTFGVGQGLSLSNVLLSSTYSIVFRSRLDDVNGPDGYFKMVDFQNRLSDNGYYNKSGAADFYDTFTEVLGPAGAYTSNGTSITVLTRDASGIFSAYVDGVEQFSFNDAAGDAIFSGPNAIAHFFIDDTAEENNESPSGFVDYIATYDHTLNDDEISALYQAGGVSEVTATPEPATITLMATGLFGVLGVARRRRKAA
jgi:hypothetical protein